jgi:hypothetical protein
MYVYFFNFTYPLRCLGESPGVRVPQVEYHCSKSCHCVVVNGYQRFGGTHCLLHQVRKWMKQYPPIRCYTSAILYGVITERTPIQIALFVIG